MHVFALSRQLIQSCRMNDKGDIRPMRSLVRTFIMVALWNRTDHYIFALWLLLSFFIPRLISAAADWMSAILPHVVWP